MERLGGNRRVKIGKTWGCSHEAFAAAVTSTKLGETCEHVLRPVVSRFSTNNTQVLGIELLPDFRHLFANKEIEFD